MKAIHFILFKSVKINKKARSIFFILGVISFNLSVAQDLKIGVLMDYKYDVIRHNTLKKSIVEEVAKTIGQTKLTLLDKNIIAANFNTTKIKDAYAQLSTSCDVIVLFGIKSTKTILELDSINTPTIALGITNVEFQGIPLTSNGTSGINNFSYILTSRSLEQELDQFYDIVPFKNLSVLFYEETANAIGEAKFLEEIDLLSKKLNSSIYPVLINDDIPTSLKAIPTDSDAAFLGTTFEIPPDGVLKIIDHLRTTGIPSYSPLQQYVEAGILSGVTSEKDATSIFRMLGLMIDEIRRGENAANLQVSLGQKKQLYFNLETSKAINFSPSFQTLFTANLVNHKLGSDEFTYGLTEILEKAIDANLGIQVSYGDIALTEQDIKDAKSYYLPTLNVGVQASQINEEATNEFIGQSERSIAQYVSLSQPIYSEQFIANIKIQKLLGEAQKFATKQEINSTIFQTYQLYLNILFAKANIIVQKENLEVLKKNLELAELQADIGARIKSDVYRWTSEVANATQRLIEAQTGLLITKASLNTFLNNTLEEDFDIEDIDLESDLFGYYDNNLLVSQIKNPQNVKKISESLNEYTKSNFPTVKQLEYSIKALERQKQLNKRVFYLPNVSLGINQSQILYRGGIASEPTSDFSNFIDSYWNVGVTLSYPLFEGNRKNIRRQQTNIQTEQLILQKRELINSLELGIQIAIAGLISGQTNIELSKKSAVNAQLNFEILQTLYSENSISIVQFFDAQNAALNAKLNHINSLYNYILSFAELENSIGFFSLLASAEEKQQFKEILNQSFNK